MILKLVNILQQLENNFCLHFDDLQYQYHQVPDGVQAYSILRVVQRGWVWKQVQSNMLQKPNLRTELPWRKPPLQHCLEAAGNHMAQGIIISRSITADVTSCHNNNSHEHLMVLFLHFSLNYSIVCIFFIVPAFPGEWWDLRRLLPKYWCREKWSLLLH